MCKDAQTFIRLRYCGGLLAIITHHARGVRLRNSVKHLVCDEIEAVVPRLGAAGVWVTRRIEPSTNLEFARQAIDSGILICAENQFVN